MYVFVPSKSHSNSHPTHSWQNWLDPVANFLQNSMIAEFLTLAPTWRMSVVKDHVSEQEWSVWQKLKGNVPVKSINMINQNATSHKQNLSFLNCLIKKHKYLSGTRVHCTKNTHPTRRAFLISFSPGNRTNLRLWDECCVQTQAC